MFAFTEDTFEQAVIELFENMGYTHIYAPDMNRTDYSRPLLDDVLRDCLVRLNRNLPVTAIDEAILKLNDFDAGRLLQKNMVFMDYLQNGITVKYAVKGEERSSVVKLIDYADADKNDFYVVNQYTFVENGNNRRPDIILFIHGLPLVLMELKSPSKDEVGAENAYNQIRNYMKDIPSMFYYNAICVISDLSTNKAGTITSGLDRFMEWKTKDGDYENTAYAQFDTFYEGMFQKERLLDILKKKLYSVLWRWTEAVQDFWRGIISISRCGKQLKKPKLPLKRMARVVCSGIRRAAENRCRWYSTPIYCKKLWIAPPSL